MTLLQPYQDPTGQMSAEQVDAQNISAIMQTINSGTDASTIPRRALTPGQISLLAYVPGPISMNYDGSGNPLKVDAGDYSVLSLSFSNNGLLNQATPGGQISPGQTFLPTLYVDLFIDPPDTSSTNNIYTNSADNLYPGGANITTALQNLTFTCYLSNSTPGPGSPYYGQYLFTYILTIRNQDSANHYYWISIQPILPADANLNNGNTAYRPS